MFAIPYFQFRAKLQPLAGLTVVDVSRLLPGPFASARLLDLGARVIKVEDPEFGDPLRGFGCEEGSLFARLNRGKKSVTIDLRTQDGFKTFCGLLEKADVLIESFKPKTMDKLGLSSEFLANNFKNLVVAHLSAFPTNTVLETRPGHDLSVMARAGFPFQTSPGMSPHVYPIQIADITAAWMLDYAIVSMLLARERLGSTLEYKQPEVFVSMYEAAQSFLLGDDRQDFAELLDGTRPAYTFYPTADQSFIAVAAVEPKFWKGFLTLLNLEHLESYGFSLGEEAKRTMVEVSKQTSLYSSSEWREMLEKHNLCVEVIEREPKVYPWVETTKHVPNLGEHNKEILDAKF